MPIPVQCECGAEFTVSDGAAGKRGRCSKCKSPLLVPNPVCEPVSPKPPHLDFADTRLRRRLLAVSLVRCVVFVVFFPYTVPTVLLFALLWYRGDPGVRSVARATESGYAFAFWPSYWRHMGDRAKLLFAIATSPFWLPFYCAYKLFRFLLVRPQDSTHGRRAKA